MKVQDTAYAEKGHPQSFGNELLLQNIDAFGAAITAYNKGKVPAICQ